MWCNNYMALPSPVFSPYRLCNDHITVFYSCSASRLSCYTVSSTTSFAARRFAAPRRLRHVVCSTASFAAPRRLRTSKSQSKKVSFFFFRFPFFLFRGVSSASASLRRRHDGGDSSPCRSVSMPRRLFNVCSASLCRIFSVSGSFPVSSKSSEYESMFLSFFRSQLGSFQ